MATGTASATSGRMPRRADIDPAEITRHLPGIQLIDVKRDPLDFVYRLVGHP